MGFTAAYTRTALIWEYPHTHTPPPPPGFYYLGHVMGIYFKRKSSKNKCLYFTITLRRKAFLRYITKGFFMHHFYHSKTINMSKNHHFSHVMMLHFCFGCFVSWFFLFCSNIRKIPYSININCTYKAWPGKLCTLLIHVFSLFDALSPLNFSNTFRNSNSVKRGAYK